MTRSDPEQGSALHPRCVGEEIPWAASLLWSWSAPEAGVSQVGSPGTQKMLQPSPPQGCCCPGPAAPKPGRGCHLVLKREHGCCRDLAEHLRLGTGHLCAPWGVLSLLLTPLGCLSSPTCPWVRVVPSKDGPANGGDEACAPPPSCPVPWGAGRPHPAAFAAE